MGALPQAPDLSLPFLASISHRSYLGLDAREKRGRIKEWR
jgi:hypothetical protein